MKKDERVSEEQVQFESDSYRVGSGTIVIGSGSR